MIMLGFLINLCQTIRLPKVIPVQKREIFTFCGGNSVIPGGRNSCIFLVYNNNPAVFAGIFFQNSQRSIFRTVIDTNNFHIVKILADNAVQTSGKILFNIINRNNNRYFRLFFHDYSPCLIAKLPVQAISWQEKSQLFQGRFIQISDSI